MEENKLFKDNIEPLQCARRGVDSLSKDKRAELFDKQRLEYGFASCDFWNFDHTILTLVANFCAYMKNSGCCPAAYAEHEWIKELDEISETAKFLRDSNNFYEDDYDKKSWKLFSWLRENLYTLWT